MVILAERTKRQKDEIFVPVKRTGTKNFMDVPYERKLEDMASGYASLFIRDLERGYREDFIRAFLYEGIASVENLRWLDFVTKGSSPVSEITSWVRESPYNPRVFKKLYGLEDVKSVFDRGFVLSPGAHAIYLRLQSIIRELPAIILAERKRLGLSSSQRYVIYNVGAAYALDAIGILLENPELQQLVSFVCIDPDEESCNCAEKIIREHNLDRRAIQVIVKKIENVRLFAKADAIMFIGMACPMPNSIIQRSLKSMRYFLKEGGLFILSTVQEKMLYDGPVLDLVMWSAGWTMFFKGDEEPGQLLEASGYSHQKNLDWEDSLGHNRMSVGRLRA